MSAAVAPYLAEDPLPLLAVFGWAQYYALRSLLLHGNDRGLVLLMLRPSEARRR